MPDRLDILFDEGEETIGAPPEPLDQGQIMALIMSWLTTLGTESEKAQALVVLMTAFSKYCDQIKEPCRTERVNRFIHFKCCDTHRRAEYLSKSINGLACSYRHDVPSPEGSNQLSELVGRIR